MPNMDEKKINLQLRGVKTTVVNYTYEGFKLNTLLALFTEKRRVFSTCEGYKEVNCVGNMYINGELSERERLKFKNGVRVNFQLELMKNLSSFLNLSFEDSAFLTTAVTMEHVAVCEKSFEEFKVICLATAGVKNNALRMGVDGGDWVEIKGDY